MMTIPHLLRRMQDDYDSARLSDLVKVEMSRESFDKFCKVYEEVDPDLVYLARGYRMGFHGVPVLVHPCLRGDYVLTFETDDGVRFEVCDGEDARA